MKHISSAFIFTILLTSVLSLPALGAVSEEPQQYVVCKNRDIVRTIHINTEESGNCTTKYTKAGNEQIVGTGRFEASCRTFLENIRGNLEAASWKCRTASSAKILRAGGEDSSNSSSQ